ncbi:hypothetical protein ACJX0J_013524, partial [Zea mays]
IIHNSIGLGKKCYLVWIFHMLIHDIDIIITRSCTSYNFFVTLLFLCDNFAVVLIWKKIFGDFEE